MQIKNWEKFQHYKNRNPPWIRLYNDLLDSPEFFALSGDDFKILAMLWMLASECNELKGYLPDSKTIAFRLRKTEEEINSAISRLSDWVVCCDSEVLAGSKQDATPDTESDTESDTEEATDFQSGLDEEQLINGSEVLIADSLKGICDELKTKNIFPTVYAFVGKMKKQGKNDRAITHTLIRCLAKETFESTPWAYCQKIISVEDGNYNESDHNRDN